MPTKFRRPAARVEYCQTDPVVLAFMEATRIQRPGAAHQALYGPIGVRARGPAAITAFLSKAPHRFAHWFAPFQAALLQVPTPDWSPALELDVMWHDTADDVERLRYQREPSTDNARRLVAFVDRSIQQLLAYRNSLVTKHRLEGQ